MAMGAARNVGGENPAEGLGFALGVATKAAGWWSQGYGPAPVEEHL